MGGSGTLPSGHSMGSVGELGTVSDELEVRVETAADFRLDRV